MCQVILIAWITTYVTIFYTEKVDLESIYNIFFISENEDVVKYNEISSNQLTVTSNIPSNTRSRYYIHGRIRIKMFWFHEKKIL